MDSNAWTGAGIIPPQNKKPARKRVWLVILIIIGIIAASIAPAYFLVRYAFNRYFENWGQRLVELEKRGMLSNEYGAGWQDVLMDKAMELEAQRIGGADSSLAESRGVVDGVAVADYPSLAVVKLLNEVREYSSTILITDRSDRPITRIKTSHRRARMEEFPDALVTALVAAEDRGFMENERGFQFDSFVRAGLRSIPRAVTSFGKRSTPRGTSTITQQVAKLFMSRLDEAGQRQVSNTVNRKVRELRLAAALRKTYSPAEILEVYMNHAVTSDHGLIGYKDIARGLLNKELDELTDAECVYLARMVKWGRNIKPKIAAQCRVDMDRMGAALGWGEDKRREVLEQIDSLTFERPKRIEGEHGPLVDLANEYWLLTLRRNGSTPYQTSQMDLIDPNSLVRRKGNLTIKLTIDLPLQEYLEKLVSQRGYGPDTTIVNEVRIGSYGRDVSLPSAPRDTVRRERVLTETVDFSEPGQSFVTTLYAGDTLIENVRYARLGSSNNYRRSVFYYMRKPTLVDGQYYAYSIMDSRTGQLLAYYSKDRLGSRLNCLLRNRTPNGSSTAKPLFNAMSFDLEEFRPYSRWTDAVPVAGDVQWSRTIQYTDGRPTGVVFDRSAVRGRGYPVHNPGRKFEGCQYVFDLLTSSNNILAVEMLYRMNRRLYDNGDIVQGAFPLVNFFYRVGALGRVRDELRLSHVTGVRVFKELCRVTGMPVDSMMQGSRRVAVSDSMFSVALGTMEMSLYEQMHLFNILYNNDLIESPSERNSLVIESIELNGMPVALNDTLRRYHPFADVNNIRPTLLGLHKRLTGNRGDGLADYDVAFESDASDPAYSSGRFDPDAFFLDDPLSNFAKSGTSDDILRPFNVDATSKKRTNYCLWNAALRVDLAKIPGAKKRSAEAAAADVKDITISCIGEGNLQYTGARDGKSQHKFLTTGLLKTAGVKAPNGYFAQYENYLRRVTPPTENCGAVVVAREEREREREDTEALEDTPPPIPVPVPAVPARGISDEDIED